MTDGSMDSYSHMVKLIRQSQLNGSLVRLNVVKGRGVKLSIPCKILNFDEQTLNLSVYDVDNKIVHLINMYEIDDFVMGS